MVLVNHRRQIDQILAQRKKDSRAPPRFAVATAPFMQLMETLLFGVKHHRAVLVESETAFGKSLAAQTLAALIGVGVKSLNLHGALMEEDLLGSPEPYENGGTRLMLKDGPLVQAMESGDWQIFEELNMGSDGVVERLNFYLSEGRLFVIRNGKKVKVNIHPNFRLIAFMNPSYYGERKPLSRPFLSRFMFWRKGRNQTELEVHLTGLLAVMSGMRGDLAQVLTGLHLGITEAAVEGWRTGAARREPYQFDQRHLLRALERMPELKGKGVKDLDEPTRAQIAVALWEVYGTLLREEEHRERLFNMLKEGLELNGLSGWPALSQAMLEKVRAGYPNTRDGVQAAAQAWLSPAQAADMEAMMEESDRLPVVPASQLEVWWLMLDSLKRGEPVLLTGTWASGKTRLTRGLFKELERPLYVQEVSAGTRKEDLEISFGMAEANGDEADLEFVRLPGALAKARRDRVVVYLDELNLATGLAESLNADMDQGQMMVASMNPATERARRPLSPAQRSRWREIWVEPVKKSTEIESILAGRMGRVAEVVVSFMPGALEPFVARRTSMGGSASVKLIDKPEERSVAPAQTPLTEGEIMRLAMEQKKERLLHEAMVNQREWREWVGHYARSRGFPESQIEVLVQKAGQLQDYLADLAVFVSKDRTVRLVPGDEWNYNFTTDFITYPLSDLMSHSVQYMGSILLHELGHREIDRLNPLNSDHRYFFHTESLNFLANCIQDTRVNNSVEQKFPGKGKLDAF